MNNKKRCSICDTVSSEDIASEITPIITEGWSVTEDGSDICLLCYTEIEGVTADFHMEDEARGLAG